MIGEDDMRKCVDVQHLPRTWRSGLDISLTEQQQLGKERTDNGWQVLPSPLEEVAVRSTALLVD